MTLEKSNAGVPVRGSSRRLWLIASLVVSGVVLLGMFLPWVSGIDFGSRFLAGGRANGWNVGWLPTTVLIGVVLCIGLVFVTARLLSLLGVAAILCSCAVSLISMASLRAAALGGAGKGFYGTFLIVSKVPLVGFWVTVLGVIGMIVFALAIGIKTILPKK
jgi:hypothetical protein